ncbi:MAG: hypothetical protein QXJ77_03115 [Candidatus Bathyarchaeia archaeon]
MTIQKTRGGLILRWSTLKGAAALMLFIASAAFVEFLIVVYAKSIGVKDDACFQIPWLGFTVSALFHLVPISTVIVLVASWTCMAEYVAIKPAEKIRLPPKKVKPSGKNMLGARVGAFWSRVKARLLKVKGVAYVWDKLSLTKAAVKSAITVLFVFLALALLISVLASPWLVYRAFASLYQFNSQILGFVKATNSALSGFVQAVAPIKWICSSIDGAIRAAAPGLRSFAEALGSLTKPLADLSPVGKYLVFQNLAAWVCALAVLAYGAYVRKSYRYKRK